MTDPRAPRRGRHAFPEAGGVPGSWSPAAAQGSSHDPGDRWPATSPGFPPPRSASHAAPDAARPFRTPSSHPSGPVSSPWSPEETAAWTWDSNDPRWDAPPVGRATGGRAAHAEPATGGLRRASGLLERWPDETGPLPPDDAPSAAPEWRHRPGDEPVDDRPPAAEAAPLPPRPAGVWSRLSRRSHRHADAPTPPGRGADGGPATVDQADLVGPDAAAEADTHTFPADWADRTGALDVIGAHVDGDLGRTEDRDGFDAARQAGGPEDELDGYGYGDEVVADDYDEHDYDEPGYDEPGYDPDDGHDYGEAGDDHTGPLQLRDEDIPVAPYDPRTGRRRRRPLALILALLVLAGIAVGVVFGGQKVIGLFAARDYTGTGTGTVKIRVQAGDTISDIGQTLVDDGVIASVRPFVTAAEKDPRATGIVPGLYALHHHMSGQAAVRLLLDPSARLVTKVTIPEGLTAAKTLERLAQATGVPLAQIQAAAANPAALGLPAYANGQLEGFLYPATYDFDPGTTPTAMLKAMVTRAVQTLDSLQIPAGQRLSVVTEASIVQAEAGSVADMPKVARVIDNRLARQMPLQLDTTVNYANGKSGITTTPQDRANPSPYNTYLHPGLPPGPISNPGEEALKAVLAPTPGDWLYFVVVNPDTGETRFAATAQEHQQNVQLFQQWLRAHPNG